MPRREIRQCLTRLMLGLIIGCAGASPAFALIMGGEGNSPLDDPGWPIGAAAVFNQSGRVAYWEGPPFGGGQWHAECRGDTAALSKVLEDFAKIEAKRRIVTLLDGVGASFWLNPNGGEEKREAAEIDWIFMIWQKDRLQMQRSLPVGIQAGTEADEEEGVIPRMTVYTGGRVKWADVKVPEGVTVDDQRLEAHGFTVADGTVIEGRVTDVDGGKPLVATVSLDGHTTVQTDADGRWVVKNVPGHFQVNVKADGYAPRLAGYTIGGAPRWYELNTSLARTARISGKVVDEGGQPLEGATVMFRDLTTGDGGRYQIPEAAGQVLQITTDAAGNFATDAVPVGTASLSVYKDGYCRPGLGDSVQLPAADVKLVMQKSAKLVVVVDFSKTTRPDGYVVNLEPEGGSKVGSYGGGGNIDASGALTYDNVPPGKYVVHGRPNPGSDDEQTEDVAVELKGGATTEVVLIAK